MSDQIISGLSGLRGISRGNHDCLICHIVNSYLISLSPHSTAPIIWSFILLLLVHH